jgi:hypothetical protein
MFLSKGMPASQPDDGFVYLFVYPPCPPFLSLCWRRNLRVMRGDVANITENPFGSHPHGDPVITMITAKLLKGRGAEESSNICSVKDKKKWVQIHT